MKFDLKGLLASGLLDQTPGGFDEAVGFFRGTPMDGRSLIAKSTGGLLGSAPPSASPLLGGTPPSPPQAPPAPQMPAPEPVEESVWQQIMDEVGPPRYSVADYINAFFAGVKGDGRAMQAIVADAEGEREILAAQRIFERFGIDDGLQIMAQAGKLPSEVVVDLLKLGFEKEKHGLAVEEFEHKRRTDDPDYAYQKRLAEEEAGAGYKQPMPVNVGGRDMLYDYGTKQWVVAPGTGQPIAGQTPGEETTDVETAKMYVGERQAATEHLEKADETINHLRRMQQLLQDYDPKTGGKAEFWLGLKKMGAYWGLLDNDIEELRKLGGGEAVVALTKKLGLSERIAGTGQMSDREFEAYKEMAPGLMNTPEGNKLLLEYSLFMANRMKDKAKAKIRYFEAKGGSLKGFEDVWEKYVAQHPAPWMK